MYSIPPQTGWATPPDHLAMLTLVSFPDLPPFHLQRLGYRGSGNKSRMTYAMLYTCEWCLLGRVRVCYLDKHSPTCTCTQVYLTTGFCIKKMDICISPLKQGGPLPPDPFPQPGLDDTLYAQAMLDAQDVYWFFLITHPRHYNYKRNLDEALPRWTPWMVHWHKQQHLHIDSMSVWEANSHWLMYKDSI